MVKKCNNCGSYLTNSFVHFCTHSLELNRLRKKIEQLKQTMREAGGDLLRGDVDGAYETLKKAVEEVEQLELTDYERRRMAGKCTVVTLKGQGWEYRCQVCSQLRFYPSTKKPVICLNCESGDILVARPGELPIAEEGRKNETNRSK